MRQSSNMRLIVLWSIITFLAKNVSCQSRDETRENMTNRDDRHNRDNDRLRTSSPTPYPTTSNAPSIASTTFPSISMKPSSGPACTVTQYDKLNGKGNILRSRLKRSNLLSSSVWNQYPDPISMKWYKIPKNAAHPSNFFCGTLSFSSSRLSSNNYIIFDNSFFGFSSTRVQIPDFTQSFVQHGSHLIPVRPGFKKTENPYYEIIVGPGRVWDEIGDRIADDNDDNIDKADDDGDYYFDKIKQQGIQLDSISYSRASFPFTLTGKNNDCTHNGVMTFIFHDSGIVSNVAYEIVKEACPSFKANMWGLMRSTYSPNIFTNDVDTKKIQRHFEIHAQTRIPIKSMSDLIQDYNIDFTYSGDSEKLIMHSFYIDGISYTEGFQTRYGKYPYPGKFRLKICNSQILCFI